MSATTGTVSGFDAPTTDGTHVEILLADHNRSNALDLVASVKGVPVSRIWDATFRKLFAFHDRNGDGEIDAKEAAKLPAPRALRQAMGNGFIPPTGQAPDFKTIDRNNDGKISPAELAEFYRSNGIGNAYVGVGKLPHGSTLNAALIKNLDTDGDGKISEAEWSKAADTLKKLDKNDDELIGAGEFIPGAVYPGATGSLLLSPIKPSAPPSEQLGKLSLRVIASETKAATDRKPGDSGRWMIRLGQTTEDQRFAFTKDQTRVEGWIAAGKMDAATEKIAKQIVTQYESQDSETTTENRMNWLVDLADRNGDGKLDRKELDTWLDLQTQVAKGQVLITVLEGGGLFELLDRNHDGALSVRELRSSLKVVKEAGCLTDGYFDPKKSPVVILMAASHGYAPSLTIDSRLGPAWFKAMDRNGDGDVSRREFTGPVELFDKLDLNKDGLLDPQESAKSEKK